MIRDPGRRGAVLAAFHRDAAARLFEDLVESGTLSDLTPDARVRARHEWLCFALYACVRGLVAAGGFNRETAAAIDALHEHALASGSPDPPPRALIAERYAEYGAIGQAGGRDAAEETARRLGEAAARHIAAPAPPPPDLAETVSGLHESLVETSAEAVRRAVEEPS
jgi:hypothetical protein